MDRKKKYKHLIINKDSSTPRWVIFSIDLIVCAVALVLAYMLRFNFALPVWEVEVLPEKVLYVLIVKGAMFILFRTYLGLIRYTSIYDAWRIFVVTSAGSLILLLINLMWFAFTKQYIIPTSVLFIDFLGSMIGLIGTRIVYKMAYHSIVDMGDDGDKVLVVGNGDFISSVKALILEGGMFQGVRVVAMIDISDKLVGQRIGPINIGSLRDADSMIANYGVVRMIIDSAVSIEQKQQLIDVCVKAHVKIQQVPNLKLWLEGDRTILVQDVQIEDLLERDVIKMDLQIVSEYISNKVVLITGAAGSIGRELVMQLSRLNAHMLVLLDQAETPLYELDLDLRERQGFFSFELVIGNVTNPSRVRKVFEVFHPQVVFHAAAYKHVPMMEENPSEAVFNNVLGTKIMADMAVEFGVEKFVMISTDKAVNPTNVMGASKRIAEIYTQTLGSQEKTKTQFITTRFGNVLGSNGSVIPRFRQQISCGGPLTITHPEITRFFMTIPEACQLVLEAGAMGGGGEIFIFDMGEPVKIVDLAKRMVQLSGLTIGRDIQISFTGLRSGEKLYEELLSSKELTKPTYHPKIMIANVRTYEQEVLSRIAELMSMLDGNNFALVRKMKDIVPEFISQNSVFQNIDRQQQFIPHGKPQPAQ